MTTSLEHAYSLASSCLKQGWDDKSIEHYVRRFSTSQGEFLPKYNGRSPSREPMICYDFNGKIELSRENVKKVTSVARKFDLCFDFDDRNMIAKISEKKRVGKREVMRITEKPERISVNSPKVIIDSGEQYGNLLEDIGEVFDIKD